MNLIELKRVFTDNMVFTLFPSYYTHIPLTLVFEPRMNRASMVSILPDASGMNHSRDKIKKDNLLWCL